MLRLDLARVPAASCLARRESTGSMNAKKILVVEDDKVTQTLIGRILKSAGYEVFTAEDAPTAIKIARQERLNLVTLDIKLSSRSPTDAWDGFTVAGWLNIMRPTPIVVISGIQPDEVLEKAAALGAYTFVPKPIEKANLLAVVADALK
jgi:CheY-like chemotaxis protein